MDESRSELPAPYRDVRVGPISSLLERMPPVSFEMAVAIGPYKTEKQIRLFFQSGLVRELEGGSVVVAGRTHFVLCMFVFPRGVGVKSHPVSVVWDGERILHFQCDCAMGYGTLKRSLSHPISTYYHSKASSVPNHCIHATVVVFEVARSQGMLDGHGVWSTDPYVKGADGRVRATKAAQKLAMIQVPSGHNYVKPETQEKRDTAKRAREEREQEERAARAGKRADEQSRKAAERARVVSLARARKAGVAARNENDKWCDCDGSATDDMVQCNACGDWFHYECVELSTALVEKMGRKHWHCSVCKAAR